MSVLAGALLAGSGAVQAATPAPVVTVLTVDASGIDFTGGTVLVAGAATNASACTLSVKPAVKGLNSSVPCGAFSVPATLPAATKSAAAVYTFTLAVSGPAGKASKTATVIVPGYPNPSVLAFRTSATFLASVGGAVTVVGLTRYATSCTLAAKPSIKGMASKVDCALFSQSVTLPGTSKTSPVPYTFTLTAKGPSGATTAVTTVTVARYPKPTVDTLTVSPAVMGLAGGLVQIESGSTFAKACSLAVSPTLPGWPVKTSCAGDTSTLMIPNSVRAMTYTVTYTVTGPGGSTSASAIVALGMAPQVTSLTTYPQSLPGAGGAVWITASAKFAQQCTLSVSPTPAGFPSASTVDCNNATTALVLPPNETDSPLTYTLTATATGPGGTTATNTTFTVAKAAPRLSPATAIAAGSYTSCALLADGRVACWDGDATWTTDNGTSDWATNWPPPVMVDAITNATSIATISSGVPGEYPSCAVLSDGHVACWDWYKTTQWRWYETNESGNDETGKVWGLPAMLMGISNATAIAAGNRFKCALLREGRVSCWGWNDSGRLGDGTLNDSSTPVMVAGITNATAISISNDHACALLTGGRVTCWGDNMYGQLGDGTRTDSATPVMVAGITNATAIAAGLGQSCALLDDGRVTCWGWNSDGQLGDGTRTNSATPVMVTGITNATAIAAGTVHTCAVLTDGRVKCWGGSRDCQLGNGICQDSAIPVVVADISNATTVAAGYTHTCALLADGRVACWGHGAPRRLGSGDKTIGSSTPVMVLGVGQP